MAMDVESPATTSNPDNGIAIPRTQPSDPSTASVLEQLHSYPFGSDPEFQDGLSAILGDPASPTTAEAESERQNLILQAKCFYFSRKQNLEVPIDAVQYIAWLDSHATPATESSQPSINGTTPLPLPTSESNTDAAPSQAQPQPPPSEALQSSQPSASSTTAATEAQAPYPSSFEHIVELITTGQPIPGIEDIPDTVLAGQEQPSVKARRKKPWEKEPDDPDPESAGIGDERQSKQEEEGCWER